MEYHITFAVIILCFVSTSCVPARHHHKRHHVKEADWDFLMFTQQWPESVCVQSEHSHHTCVIPRKVKTWTVHGVWPSRKDGEGPYNCNASARFDPEKLQSIMSRLNQYWPNLFEDTEPTNFWEHEWDKHGTCAMVLPSLSTELKYFTTGLNWNIKYDIYSALMKKNIKPGSSSVSNTAVLKAISSAFRVTPRLTCYTDRSTGESYLNQIELCISKEFKVFDCPDSTTLRFVPQHKQNWGYSKDCPDSFIYPAIQR